MLKFILYPLPLCFKLTPFGWGAAESFPKKNTGMPKQHTCIFYMQMIPTLALSKSGFRVEALPAYSQPAFCKHPALNFVVNS